MTRAEGGTDIVTLGEQGSSWSLQTKTRPAETLPLAALPQSAVPWGSHSKTALFMRGRIGFIINNVLFLDSFGKSENFPRERQALRSILLEYFG